MEEIWLLLYYLNKHMEEGIKSDMEKHPGIVLRVPTPPAQVVFIILRSLFSLWFSESYLHIYV